MSTADESRFGEMIAEADRSGNVEPLVVAALGARFAADEGRYCECEAPAPVGRDIMCGNCLLENRGQIEKWVKESGLPHKFKPRPSFPTMCDICTMWEDDPRHHAGERGDADG